MKLYSRIILLLLILQADVTGYLTALSFVNVASGTTFGLLLTIDLVSFAMMTYIYRTERLQGLPARKWIIAGSAIIAAIFFSGLIFA